MTTLDVEGRRVGVTNLDKVLSTELLITDKVESWPVVNAYGFEDGRDAHGNG
jgi:hypothetical protein